MRFEKKIEVGTDFCNKTMFRKDELMKKEFLSPSTLGTPVGYSQLVTVQGGTLILLSGQIPVNSQNELVGKNDLATQTKQVFENIGLALKAVDVTFTDVVKLTYYIVNYKFEDRQTILKVRDEYVSLERPPASTLIGVQALALPDFLIEIEAIAFVE